MDKKQMIIAGVLIVAVVVAVGALYYAYVIRGRGRIGTLGVDVYGEAELTNKVTEIDWGTIFPGQDRRAQLWIVNTGNVPGNLTLTDENWVPLEAKNYIVLSWNYTEGELNQGEALHVELRLDVLEDITGISDFSMDIIIGITHEELASYPL